MIQTLRRLALRPPVRLAVYAVFLAASSALLTEAACRLLYPHLGDEQAYLDRALGRLLNSYLETPPASSGPGGRIGYPLKPRQKVRAGKGSRAYTVETNSQGFRCRDLEPKAATEFRLLLLGDSMVYGVGARCQGSCRVR